MSTLLSSPPAAPRRSMRRAALVVVVLLLISVALFWFQPWKLVVDDRVDAPLPTASTAQVDDEPAPTGQPSPPAEPEPLELRQGTFISRDHGTSGVVRVLELADGSRFLRLEQLDTENGPDLYVYLTTTPADGDEGAIDDDFVSLGRLQGNIGNQNYELPEDVDLERYTTVVIWCDRFNSAFGAAGLSA